MIWVPTLQHWMWTLPWRTGASEISKDCFSSNHIVLQEIIFEEIMHCLKIKCSSLMGKAFAPWPQFWCCWSTHDVYFWEWDEWGTSHMWEAAELWRAVGHMNNNVMRRLFWQRCIILSILFCRVLLQTSVQFDTAHPDTPRWLIQLTHPPEEERQRILKEDLVSCQPFYYFCCCSICQKIWTQKLPLQVIVGFLPSLSFFISYPSASVG